MRNPAVDERGREKGAALNFGWRQDKRAFVNAAKDSDELHAGHRARCDRSDFFEWSLHSHFFLEFARGGFRVGLSGVDVTGGTRIPA